MTLTSARVSIPTRSINFFQFTRPRRLDGSGVTTDVLNKLFQLIRQYICTFMFLPSAVATYYPHHRLSFSSAFSFNG